MSRRHKESSSSTRTVQSTSVTRRDASVFQSLILSSGLVAVVFALYWPATRFGFINLDDQDYVTDNPHVTSGLKWVNVSWAFRTGHADNWHPLTWLSHMLDCQFFALDAGAHHFVNLIFHVLNTLLLFGLLKWMTKALWLSVMVAALFALHPLNVESVVWISQRKLVLSTFFGLLSLLAYFRCATSVSSKPARNNRIAFYVLSLLFFSLSLMCKPMLVTLPFLLLLLDYWPIHRILIGAFASRNQPRDQTIPSAPAVTLRRAILEKAPFFSLSLASCIITFRVQKGGGAVDSSLSFSAKLANAAVSYSEYLRQIFWPNNLCIFYPHPGHWAAARILVSLAILALLSSVIIVWGRRRPWLVVGWLWFVGTLVPVIGLVQVGLQSMADRYTYVSSIGLFIALVWGINDCLRERAGRRWLFAMTGSLVLTVLGFLTVQQIQYWRNSETVFRRALKVTEANFVAHDCLGVELVRQGKIPEAVDHFHEAIRIQPNYPWAHSNLGKLFLDQKQWTDAIAEYQESLRLNPQDPVAHNNLGIAFATTGNMDDAVSQLRLAISCDPGYASAHNNLGKVLMEQHKLNDAINEYRESIRLEPGEAGVHNNLGVAYAMSERLDEAVSHFQDAVRLDSANASAQRNLGDAFAQQQKWPAASSAYRQALRLTPGDLGLYMKLGNALAQQGSIADAAAQYQEALRIKPDFEPARRELMKISQAPAVPSP